MYNIYPFESETFFGFERHPKSYVTNVSHRIPKDNIIMSSNQVYLWHMIMISPLLVYIGNKKKYSNYLCWRY